MIFIKLHAHLAINTYIYVLIYVYVLIALIIYIYIYFPDSSGGKESTCNAGDPCSIDGSGRFPGERNGNSFQYSSLENSMDGGAWQATVHEAAKSQT